ncbi:Methionyl-tRNA formyltransferase [Microbotryomycetes sp. JL221]|nr:Methionyl-tRNA formyltransferase [Microbotryomycetes sp. JL221]
MVPYHRDEDPKFRHFSAFGTLEVIDTDLLLGFTLARQAPLRQLAEQLELETMSLPSTLLKEWDPPQPFRQMSSNNLLITASFGHLIPNDLLNKFEPLHCLNVHPSLLPHLRGAAPIQWTIAKGLKETGVTVQELSKGKFDHGKILAQTKLQVPDFATFETLEPILAQMGSNLLIDVLRNFSKVKKDAQGQDSKLATLAPKITKQHARIQWKDMTREEIVRMQRGFGHQVPLWTTLRLSNSQEPVVVQLEIHDPQTHESLSIKRINSSRPGERSGVGFIDSKSRRLIVQCGSRHDDDDNVVQVDKLKMPGSKWVKVWDWSNGVGKALLNETGFVKFE